MPLLFIAVNAEQGNMEGKEVRFGTANSALWAAATTAASNGSVNSMHDSFTPIGGLIPMFLMQLGEVVFGGVGSGLYGMIVFAIVAVFVAGLMVGRTPEYLGKKIEAFEMKMASIAILVPPLCVLAGAALAVVTPMGLGGLQNHGPHGFSEILYAFTSMGNNNGSAFAGYGANNPLVNFAGGFAMLVSRYLGSGAGAGHRGVAGAKEDRTRGSRHAAHSQSSVCRAARQHGADRGRPGIHSRAGARSHCGGSSMKSRALFEPRIVRVALIDSFRKLDPRHQARNPVMFVVLVGSVLTTALGVHALFGKGEAPASFILAISVWLWFTVLFANFAEAMAEGRGKAQADTLRKSRRDVSAKKLSSPAYGSPFTVVRGRYTAERRCGPRGSG